MFMNRKQRKVLAASTLEVLKTGHLGDSDISELIQSSQQRTCSYPENHNIPIQAFKPVNSSSKTVQTQIRLFNMTTLAAAHKLLLEADGKEPTPVAVLNFASAKNPGGGFIGGSLAQEESLALNSGLYACLKDDPIYAYHRKHPNDGIYSDWTIFSPDVPVFRNEVEGSLLDTTPWVYSVVTCPCINAGVAQQRLNLSESDLKGLLRKRMLRMLTVLAAHHDGDVVLGAWGCGVFKNDPHVIAALFSELLQDERFAHRWPKIIFGVLDKDKGRTIRAFESVFGKCES